MTYLILSVVSIPILILLAAQDFRERMIYSFPVLILAGAWAVYSAWIYKDMPLFIILTWTIILTLYAVYKVFGIWGDGDSDAFLLFAGILLCTLDIKNMLQFGFALCIGLGVSLAFSLTMGVIEAAMRKQKLDWHSNLAVIPGFSLSLITVMVYGMVREVVIV